MGAEEVDRRRKGVEVGGGIAEEFGTDGEEVSRIWWLYRCLRRLGFALCVFSGWLLVIFLVVQTHPIDDGFRDRDCMDGGRLRECKGRGQQATDVGAVEAEARVVSGIMG